MSVDHESLMAEHRDLVAIQKRIGDAMEDGRWHSAAREIVGLFRMSRPQPAPEPAKTDPRRTVGAVVRSVADGPLWAVIVAGPGSLKLRALSADPGIHPWGYTEASDEFVRWMTRAECDWHGIPYAERGATDTTPPAATEPAVAESYCGADCLNMIGAVIDYYGQAFIVKSHGCSQLLGHPKSLACGHNTPSAITFLRWANREECERHGIPYVERGAAPSPAASPAAYVPKCGDVVTVCDDEAGQFGNTGVVTEINADGFAAVRFRNEVAARNNYAAWQLRPATAAERVAAGLDAPAVDREGLIAVMEIAARKSCGDVGDQRSMTQVHADAAIEFFKAKGGA